MDNLSGIKLMIFFLTLIPLQYLIFNLLRFLKRACWDPIRITKKMEAQGIRGPPYKFFNGNTAEANKLVANAITIAVDQLSHNVFPKVQPHFYSWIELYGQNFLTWHGPTPRLVVGEAELAKEILSDRNGKFPKYKPPAFIKKLLGDGLVTANGQKWARQRKLAAHAFRSESLKGMIPEIIAALEGMLQKWDRFEGKEIDFFEEFTILTSEIISRTAFGSSYIEGKEIFIKLDELAEIAARNFYAVRLPFLRRVLANKDERESDRIEQSIREHILMLIKRREGEGYGEDFLGSLMEAHHESGSITLDDIIDECKTFYFAGQETTSAMLSWTSFLLAVNPDWQDRVRIEILKLFGDRNPTPEDFSAISSKLKTMTMVIYESMRLYPPVLNMMRSVAAECRVGGGDVVLPKGMEIQIPPLPINHKHSAWGDDAQLFVPERFAEGFAGATPDGGEAAGFFPFGVGPRQCVGQGLAMLEAKLALTLILQRYSFTLSPGYVHSPVPRLTCRPQRGILLVLQKLRPAYSSAD